MKGGNWGKVVACVVLVILATVTAITFLVHLASAPPPPAAQALQGPQPGAKEPAPLSPARWEWTSGAPPYKASPLPGDSVVSSTGVGLEAALRRAVSDSWTLLSRSLYETDDPAFRTRIRLAVKKAQRIRRPSQIEVPVDSDEDGVPDLWVYFSQDRPAFIEADLFQVGCHDLRIVLEQSQAKIEEDEGWFLSPPLPLPLSESTPLRPADFYDRALLAGGVARHRSLVAQWAEELLPELSTEFDVLAKSSGNEGKEDLTRYEAQVLSLLPRFERTFREEKMAQKLVFPGGWKCEYLPYDGDGRLGQEVIVGYAPWGVAQVRFFSEGAREKQSFLANHGLLADCFLENGSVFRIDLGGHRYFRLGKHWGRLRGDVRVKIAERCLLPAFVHYRKGDWYDAVQMWRQGLRLAGLTGDFRIGKNGLPDASLNGGKLVEWGFSVAGWQAAGLLKTATSMVKRSSDSEGIGELAAQAAQAKDFAEALTLLTLEVRLNKKLGCTTGQVNALENMSRIYARLGNADMAIRYLFQSLDLEASLGYAQDIVANLPHLVGERSLDAASSQQALRSAMEMRSHAMTVNRACNLAQLASLYGNLGERDKGKGFLEEAERLFKNLGHRYGQADVHNVRAEWSLAEGRPEHALEQLTAARELVRLQALQVESSRKPPKGSQSTERPPLHSFQLPERHFQKYVVFLTAPSHPRCYEALTLGLMGQAYWQQALAAGSDAGRKAALLDQSAACQLRARDCYREAGDTEGELTTRLRLAIVAFAHQDHAKALKLARQVAEESKEQRVFELRWRSLALEGATLAATAKNDEALRAYRAAAEEIESVRGMMYSESARRGFLSLKITVYEHMARLCIARGSDSEVWECMERSKARTLLDMISGQSLQVKGREVAQLSSTAPVVFHHLRGTAQPGRLAPEQFEQELAQSLSRIADRAEMQELLSLQNVQPLGLKSVQQVLGAKTVLIEYLATEDETLAAVISAKGLEIVRLPGYGMATLGREVAAFRAQLQNSRSRYQEQARKLYRDLLAPCLEKHPQCEHLVIVPSGALHYLPFQALLADEEGFVIQRRMVSYAPSAAALVYCLRKGRTGTAYETADALVVGQPQAIQAFSGFSALPSAEWEAEQIHQRLPKAKPLLKNASETVVKAALADASLFHFAGHAELMPSTPMRSALLCADSAQDDGRLEVRELFGMDLHRCQMAVLSACRTQVGDWSRGDEIVGLSRAFLRAGVPTVVATLWDVPDDTTARIMTRFYKHLAAPGMSRLTALVQTQREYLANQLRDLDDKPSSDMLVSRGKVAIAKPDDSKVVPPESFMVPPNHPYYWAAFELTGDWR